jgi:crotonobetainyl-CoA:carnitine CoA-transferase CaiB-like acyl-CoA transferase
LFTVIAIQSALRARDATGVGQKVDTSLLTSAVAWLANVGQSHLVSGKPARRFGNAHANIVPYQVFRARDQHITIGVGNDRQFRSLCEVLGRPEVADDERFRTNPQRVAYRDELIELLQSVFETRDADEWLDACYRAGIPSGKINTVEQVFEHPQVLARDMLVEIEHSTAGMLKMAGIPYAMSETPASIRLAPPTLGQHTDEVLREMGRSDDEIRKLHESGAV